jgi:hypothetical protein
MKPRSGTYLEAFWPSPQQQALLPLTSTVVLFAQAHQRDLFTSGLLNTILYKLLMYRTSEICSTHTQ